MKLNRTKDLILRYLNGSVIEGLLSIIILLILFKYLIFHQNKDISTIIDFTIFFGIVVAFVSKFITHLLSSWIRQQIEDQIKLDTNYNRIVSQYPCCTNMLSYTNSSASDFKLGRKKTTSKNKCIKPNEDQYIFPITQEYLGDHLSFIIIDSPVQYQLPDRILNNYDEIMSAHSSSSVYNQLNIRLDECIITDTTATFKTSRTSYFDSLVTNRAMDFKWKNGLSVRDLYAYGPFLPSLEESLLSNHLGFNGFVETSDQKIIFVVRSGNVSIGKNTLGTSIAASLKTMYSLNDKQKFTLNGLKKGIISEIKDELAIDSKYYDFDLETNIIGIYRDIIEGGKPQLLFYVKVNCPSTDVETWFHKDSPNSKDKWNLQKKLKQDGSKLIFVDRQDLEKIYITPDILIIDSKPYRVMPSASASLVMLIQYLKILEVK